MWTLNQQTQYKNANLARKAMDRFLMIQFKGSSCFCLGYSYEYVKVSKQNHVTCQMNMLNSNFLNKIERRNTELDLWIDTSVYIGTKQFWNSNAEINVIAETKVKFTDEFEVREEQMAVFLVNQPFDEECWTKRVFLYDYT